jgi:hypothetical protein
MKSSMLNSMKRSILAATATTAVFVLGSSGLAQAHGPHDRCGMPQGYPCQDFYNRFDAYKKLQANENGDTDAMGNLDLVEGIQKRLNLNLEYAVDNFIYVQQALGGANSTTQARRVFTLLAQSITPFNPLHELANELVRLNAAENSIEDAIGNFTAVITVVNQGLNLQATTNLFLATLQLEGGTNSTTSARSSFSMITREMNQFPLDEMFEGYSRIFKAENGHEDAVGNFALVIRAAALCHSFRRAAEDFISVLAQSGGASGTSQARTLYKRLYGI